ncbi:MAG: D-2-hydroxyacid dehydrogenase [Phycisphaerales bacterium]|nr:D-2-hydroxyacid dehydrogenase [Phycisphaerales bacterium]
MLHTTRRLAALVGCSLALSVTAAIAQPDADAIGSARGARIAVPMPADPADRPTLIYLAAGLSDEQLAELRTLAPNVRVLLAPSRQDAMQHAGEVQGVDGRFASPEFIAAAPHLSWVQSPSAGVDRYLGNKALMENDAIVLTNMRAVHGPAIADHAFAMLLTLTRNLREYERDQAAGRWGGDADGPRAVALQGKTMFVIGLGGIGAEIAQRAHGFGMRVIASRRSDAPSPDYIDHVGKPEDLLAMLPEADVVAVCVPLTPETRGMIDAKAFAAMKDGAYIINIARGPIVETDALIHALKSGHLAGACLDVTDPEPLPPGHALWSLPNVIITPHVASDAPQTQERWWALFRENVRRFGAGEPLLNTVDKQAGY